MVERPLEPIYEETIVGASAQSERERNARNAQQKMNRQNKCQRLIEVGIGGDKIWPLVDRKTVSFLYLIIGVERRRILNCKNPHIIIDTLTTVNFWKIVEEAFIRPRYINFHRHVFLITNNFGEKRWNFYGKLKELAENCDFENKEETLIRYVFITNLIDPEIQKELLKQTVEPRQALELAINMEMGMPNCNNCGLLNHFAKVCRKQKTVKPVNAKKKMMSVVEDEPHPEDSVIFLQPAKLYELDYSSGEDNTVAVIENSVE